MEEKYQYVAYCQQHFAKKVSQQKCWKQHKTESAFKIFKLMRSALLTGFKYLHGETTFCDNILYKSKIFL